MKYDIIREVSKSGGQFDVIHEIEKFNPYHDSKGRFSTADGAASFTYKPGQGKMYDNAIAREKERQAAMSGPKPKAEFVNQLGQAHAEALEKIVAGSSEEIQGVWAKYGDKIKVSESDCTRTAHCDSMGAIHVNIAKDSDPNKSNGMPQYETTMHECGHSIEKAISLKYGGKFASTYNDGEFEKTIIREANSYIKKHQKQLQESTGEKVSIEQARTSLGKIMRREGFVATGDVSDMLEGATKGKFSGSGGHGKSYWTGYKTYWGKTQGHSVADEAFAEMFTSSTTNPASLKKIKEVFPESYNLFSKMIKEATSYD